ncbi:MAG: hypothetical protein IPL43_13490 [Micropruina sp.]|nr:hypothetical protein [Micropruina sp.]
MPLQRSTSAPQLAALAARSNGTASPSSRPDCERVLYLVPKRCDPRDSDSAPMEAKPWFCSSTMMTLMPSWAIVAISIGSIW